MVATAQQVSVGHVHAHILQTLTWRDVMQAYVSNMQVHVYMSTCMMHISNMDAYMHICTMYTILMYSCMHSCVHVQVQVQG